MTMKKRKDIVTLNDEKRWIDAADFQRLVEKVCLGHACHDSLIAQPQTLNRAL